MLSLPLTKLLHNVIREYGKYAVDHYAVDLRTLNDIDKKLLLSHVTDSDEYEYACSSPSRLAAMFTEYDEHIESLIHAESYDVFAEDMEEAGMMMIRHPGNDECSYVRRSL